MPGSAFGVAVPVPMRAWRTMPPNAASVAHDWTASGRRGDVKHAEPVPSLGSVAVNHAACEAMMRAGGRRRAPGPERRQSFIRFPFNCAGSLAIDPRAGATDCCGNALHAMPKATGALPD
ncbi:hypothetical protein BURPS305_6289 [Burkholderia pseudomallei 305]|nr:hypothetical protein BURPS305_6289 [Burkholderia pseudomallei 305]